MSNGVDWKGRSDNYLEMETRPLPWLAPGILILVLFVWSCSLYDRFSVAVAGMWPATYCTVRTVDKVQTTDGGGGYFVTVSYEYQVGGKRYEGTQDRFYEYRQLSGQTSGGKCIYPEGEAKTIETNFPKGPQVQVHYNPLNAADSRIDCNGGFNQSFWLDQWYEMCLVAMVCVLGLVLRRIYKWHDSRWPKTI
jgi:hypothetical protein